MDMSQIINQMIVLFLLMGVGYTCGKIGYMDADFSKKLTNIILMVTTPAMILASVTVGDVSFPKSTAFQVLGVSAALFLVLIPAALLSALVLKVEKSERNLYIFMALFSNTGFMGYPVVKTIFGDGAVFLASLYNMIFNILVYSLGVWLMNSGKGKFSLKTLINPSMISSIVAMIIFVGELKLPYVLSATFDAVGSITSPCAMMLIGASLSLIPVKEIFTEIRLYPFAFIKQIILPFVVMSVFKFFVKDPTILGIITVLAAMPVASIAVMFANQYSGNSKLASKGVFITTMCSFITIPLLCMFMA